MEFKALIPYWITVGMIILAVCVGVYILESMDFDDIVCKSINATVYITSSTCGVRGNCPPKKCVFDNGTLVDIPIITKSIAGGR